MRDPSLPALRTSDATSHPGEVARTELHASEERFRQLVDAVTDYAIFMLDATGHVATWNSGAQKTKGYTLDEIVGQHFSVFYTPEDRADGKPERMLQQAEREGRAEDESWRVRQDGSRFWANVVITVLRGPQGEARGFAKVTRDLSAKRALDEELHASEQRFHQLVDAVTDYAIFMLDSTGHVATWNAGAQKAKGYAAHEIVGQHFSVFYTPEDRAVGKPAAILAQVRDQGRVEDEGWRLRQDGSRFWANVVITALRDQQSAIIGFAKVTRDLTARRAAEANERDLVREQLARSASEVAREEMERVNRAKDEFLATMSHELRTPLNAIAGWAAILRRTPRDESKLDRGLEVIERNAKAQTRLINDLLDVSRIISGKLQLNLSQTEVLPAIVSAADVVRLTADSKGVRLAVEVDPDIGAIVADPDRLQQIVGNLLGNAVRFTPPGGRVTITAAREGAGIRMAVHDTGAGIAAEHVPHLFERFRQVDSSTTRAHGGLGLGLAIVRHLVEAHGGSVAARSEGLGKGSTFTLNLPVRAMNAAAAEAEAIAPSRAASSLAHLRVLIVDDDPDSLEVLRTVLESAGASVTAVCGAHQALEALEASGPFALIVSDIGMPEVDGYSFIRRVRSREPGAAVPAIALTAYAHASDAEQARRAGFQVHLAKPVDEQQLLRAVASWSQVTLRVGAADVAPTP